MGFEPSLFAYADAWASRFGNRQDYMAAVSILEAERSVRRFIVEFLAEKGLTISQWTVLTIVHLSALREQSLTIGDIADALQVHSSTVTNAIVKLEPHGWLTRVPLDGRTVQVAITADGAARLVGIQEELVQARFGLAGLSHDVVAQVSESLMPVLTQRNRA